MIDKSKSSFIKIVRRSRSEQNKDSSNSSEVKPFLDPIYWEEIYRIEKEAYVGGVLKRKAAQVLKWDERRNYLIEQSLIHGSTPETDQEIKSLQGKIEFLTTEIELSNNLLNAIDTLGQSYVHGTVKMYDAWKQKKAELEDHINLLNQRIAIYSLCAHVNEITRGKDKHEES
jgi:hypothetical protein